jgi:hypothetical protein
LLSHAYTCACFLCLLLSSVRQTPANTQHVFAASFLPPPMHLTHSRRSLIAVRLPQLLLRLESWRDGAGSEAPRLDSSDGRRYVQCISDMRDRLAWTIEALLPRVMQAARSSFALNEPFVAIELIMTILAGAFVPPLHSPCDPHPPGMRPHPEGEGPTPTHPPTPTLTPAPTPSSTPTPTHPPTPKPTPTPTPTSTHTHPPTPTPTHAHAHTTDTHTNTNTPTSTPPLTPPSTSTDRIRRAPKGFTRRSILPSPTSWIGCASVACLVCFLNVAG